MVEMKSRERVERALNHEETDRIPIDIGGISNLTTMHKDAYVKLQKYLGHEGEPITLSSMLSQSVEPDEYVRKRFKADCFPIYTTGPKEYLKKLQTNPEDGSTFFYDEFNVKWKKPAKGLYYDPVENPLKGATLEDMEKFNWPDPRNTVMIDGLGDRAKEVYENTDYAIVVGGPFNGGIYVPCQWLIGHEDYFKKLMKKKKREEVDFLMDKIVEYHINQWDLLLDEVGKYASVAVLSDDLGSQISPLIRPSVYRDIIKPAHKKVVDFIKSKVDGIKVVYHCDGAITDFFDDLVDVGYDAWNPIQVSARGIEDTKALKQTIGDKMCFWGGTCDSQGTLSRGTPEQVREEVKARIKDLAPQGGLVLSSVHNIQRDVPIENLVALYDSFYEYGTAYYQGKL